VYGVVYDRIAVIVIITRRYVIIAIRFFRLVKYVSYYDLRSARALPPRFDLGRFVITVVPVRARTHAHYENRAEIETRSVGRIVSSPERFEAVGLRLCPPPSKSVLNVRELFSRPEQLRWTVGLPEIGSKMYAVRSARV